MLPMSVRDNLSLAALDRLSRGGVLGGAPRSQAVAGMVRRLSIKVGRHRRCRSARCRAATSRRS